MKTIERGQYAPYGQGWRKSMASMYNSYELEAKAGKKGSGLSKDDLIGIIRANNIVQLFNSQYAVGDWAVPGKFQVRGPAWENDGKPVFLPHNSDECMVIKTNEILIKIA